MRRTCAALLTILPVVGGCYTYSYHAPDRPVQGMAIEVTLNDLGRLRMEPHIGAEVLRVEGFVASVVDSTFTIRVQKVTGIDRQQTRWSLEPVAFQLAYVREMRERRFSPGKTAILAGGFTASIVAFIATRSLIAGGFGDRNPPGGGPGDPPDN